MTLVVRAVPGGEAQRTEVPSTGPLCSLCSAGKIQDAFAQPGLTQSNGRVLRESMLMGPAGGVKMQTVWEGNNLITVILYGAGSR